MEKLMISTEEKSELGVHVLHLSGTVDVFSYKELKEFLDKWILENSVKRVLVDMQKVAYVGSSGWSVLFLQSTAQEKEGGILVLYEMTERVKRSLDLIMPKKRGIYTAGTFEEAVEVLNMANKA